MAAGGYSSRSATVGSTREARIAGQALAAMATLNGSHGFRPKSSVRLAAGARMRPRRLPLLPTSVRRAKIFGAHRVTPALAVMDAWWQDVRYAGFCGS
jgi:hypothetical protein